MRQTCAEVVVDVSGNAIALAFNCAQVFNAFKFALQSASGIKPDTAAHGNRCCDIDRSPETRVSARRKAKQ